VSEHLTAEYEVVVHSSLSFAVMQAVSPTPDPPMGTPTNTPQKAQILSIIGSNVPSDHAPQPTVIKSAKELAPTSMGPPIAPPPRTSSNKQPIAAADVTRVTGLGLVGSEGVNDGGRGNIKTRQDHSASASRRKETRFGEYVLGQTLGEGEFGKVKLGWKKDGSVQVAIKLIRRDSLGSNPSRLPKIYREISILRELSHPNIVRLYEMVETDRHIGIILEYASGGELFDYILNHRYLKDNPARRLFAQLVSGVGYLHKKGIVHRDLKLENLLLDKNRNIIITDFGFANTFDPKDELGDEIEYNLANRDVVKKLDLERVLENGHRRGDLMQTSCGSPCYAAPELVVSESLYTGRKVDVWSCGVILVSSLYLWILIKILRG
jgi:protein-serine/threonine kinase